MNERIKLLAKQSLPEFYLTNCPSALEKFAELIVRECAEVAYKRSVHSGPSDILKHFGIEE
jgi:hypothetical protein